MRILALDWGSVRVGGAISDVEGKFAFPLDKFFQSKTAADEIKKLVIEQEVEKIILGNPKALSGKESKSQEKVFEFAESLKKQIQIPIEMLDERFSSVAATSALHEQGLSEKKQRDIKDNMTAQLLLQSYLDSRG